VQLYFFFLNPIFKNLPHQEKSTFFFFFFFSLSLSLSFLFWAIRPYRRNEKAIWMNLFTEAEKFFHFFFIFNFVCSLNGVSFMILSFY